MREKLEDDWVIIPYLGLLKHPSDLFSCVHLCPPPAHSTRNSRVNRIMSLLCL